SRGRRSTRGSREPSTGSASGAWIIPKRTRTSSPKGSRAISSMPSSPPPSELIALYGPTASGKTAVAKALADRVGGEVISADSAALYAGIPILTAAPTYPARLVGVVPLDRD